MKRFKKKIQLFYVNTCKSTNFSPYLEFYFKELSFISNIKINTSS